MLFYNKTDMVYQDYGWSEYAKTDPQVSDKLDSTLFNKQQGNQVLYFINKMAQLHSLVDKKDAKKMEKMIHDNLPPDIKNQDKVKIWVMKNWKYY